MSRCVALLVIALFGFAAKPCSVDSPCFNMGYEDGWAFATMAAYERMVWLCEYNTKSRDPLCMGAREVHNYLDAELRDMR